MEASAISDVVKRFLRKDIPYRCILVDGAWGVGKTFAVQKALEESAESKIYVSLFGINSMKALMTEIMVQLYKVVPPVIGNVLKRNRNAVATLIGNIEKIPKIGGALKDFSTLASDIVLSQGGIIEILKYIEKKKENILMVFDDLERTEETLGIKSIFGLIDSIRVNTNIKILVVANSEEMPNSMKTVFQQFSEKVIDRKYEVTEVSNSVWTNTERFNKAFVDEFYQRHKFTNLRTLFKAQDFYTDVEIAICDILGHEREMRNQPDKAGFYDEVQKICYGVVFEENDKFERRKLEQALKNMETEEAKRDDFSASIYNVVLEDQAYLIQRNYVFESYFQDLSIINAIICYYKGDGELDTQMINTYYEAYKKSNAGHDYFKSQEELAEMIKSIQCDIKGRIENPYTIFEKANTAAIWMNVLGEDPKDILDTAENRLFESYTHNLRPIDPRKRLPQEIVHDIKDFGKYEMFWDRFGVLIERISGEFWKTLFEECKEDIEDGKYEEASKLLSLAREKIEIYYNQKGIGEFYNTIIIPALSLSGSITGSQNECMHWICQIDRESRGEKVLRFMEEDEKAHSDDKMLKHRYSKLKEQYYGEHA